MAQQFVDAHLGEIQEILGANDLRTQNPAPAAPLGEGSDLFPPFGFHRQGEGEVLLGQRDGGGVRDGCASPVPEDGPQRDLGVPRQPADGVEALRSDLGFDALTGVELHPTGRHGRAGYDRPRLRIRHVAHDRRFRLRIPAGTEIDEGLRGRGVHGHEHDCGRRKAHKRVRHVHFSPPRSSGRQASGPAS